MRLTRRDALRIGGAAAAGALLGCPADPAGGVDAGGEPGAADAAETDATASDAAVTDHQVQDRSLVEDGAAADREDAAMSEDAGLAPSPPPPLFFLQISDLHIGGDELAVPGLTYALQTIRPAIAPAATLVTGDLVDLGSDDTQWTQYQSLVDAVSPDAATFFEVPGNHDAKQDPELTRYLLHTVTGRAGLGLYGVRPLEVGGRRIRVISINTASGGGYTRNLTGYLATEQVDALLAEIDADPSPVDATLVLGHHPGSGLDGLALFNTDDELYRLLDHVDTAAYLFGHLHIFRSSWRGPTLLAQADTAGNPSLFSGHPGLSLLALDDGPCLRNVPLVGDPAEVHVDWPLVIITRPGDRDLGDFNPRATAPPRARAGQLLRAGVFCPDGAAPDLVRFRVDGGDWGEMLEAGGWWEARFDTPDADTCAVEVEARAVGHTRSDSARVALS